MNLVVEAALIGVGGSVIVAVVAFLSSFFTTRRQLGDAQRARVWDKQAAAYVDAVTAVRWQQERRQRQFRALARGTVLVASDAVRAEQAPVDWSELGPRLFAFASPAVLKAMQAASYAGIEARSRYQKWEESVREARAMDVDKEPHVMANLHSGHQAAKQALQAADDKDDALIEAIRVDLHGKAGAALDLLAPSAQITTAGETAEV
jgi:hypothetical protein